MRNLRLDFLIPTFLLKEKSVYCATISQIFSHSFLPLPTLQNAIINRHKKLLKSMYVRKIHHFNSIYAVWDRGLINQFCTLLQWHSHGAFCRIKYHMFYSSLMTRQYNTHYTLSITCYTSYLVLWFQVCTSHWRCSRRINEPSKYF